MIAVRTPEGTNMMNLSGSLVAASIVVLAISCGSGSGRKVEITQTDGGCTPSNITATAGEKLNLVVKNASGAGPYRLERISGPPLQNLAVAQGSTRSAGYTLPAGDGTYKLSCFVLGGVSTTVQIVAGKGASAESPSATGNPTSAPSVTGTAKAPDATVGVKLVEYSVTPDRPSVPAGTIRFNAMNVSKTVEHELVVQRVRDDGSADLIGKVGDIHPGETKSLTLDLTPGTYRLACLRVTPVDIPPAKPVPTAGADSPEAEPDPEATLVPGQPVIDHYQLGMHVLFRVD
ncbi:MAG: cupredoxin domain-containing protein [Chloroflexota bacterium]|nr:cupredoxin domain-containing protein [Chloroflexota bacterium]